MGLWMKSNFLAKNKSTIEKPTVTVSEYWMAGGHFGFVAHRA